MSDMTAMVMKTAVIPEKLYNAPPISGPAPSPR